MNDMPTLYKEYLRKANKTHKCCGYQQQFDKSQDFNEYRLRLDIGNGKIAYMVKYEEQWIYRKYETNSEQ